MSGFLYYLPAKTQGLSAAGVRAMGLDYAIEDAIRGVEVLRGPDGGAGLLVANAANVQPSETAYRPDRQTWMQWRANVWVGMYDQPETAPSPQSLARPRQLAGHVVQLLDGRGWLVPVARGWTEEEAELRWYHTLPRRSRLADDGRWQPGDVVATFAPLWQLANQWLECEAGAAAAALRTEGSRPGETVRAEFDFSGIHESAIEVLAVRPVRRSSARCRGR